MYSCWYNSHYPLHFWYLYAHTIKEAIILWKKCHYLSNVWVIFYVGWGMLFELLSIKSYALVNDSGIYKQTYELEPIPLRERQTGRLFVTE